MLSFVARSIRRRRAEGPPADGAALLQRLARGDRTALDALYRQEAGAVYRYALALCRNAAWAADVTQDAFVALASQPLAFDPARGSLGAWLAGTARHALLALWRDAGRHQPWPEDDHLSDADIADLATPLPVSPEAVLVREQDIEGLWAALRSLPWAFREAVVLVDLQGRAYAEAAQIAGIDLNTLRTRVHRGRLKLAAVLNAAPGGQR
jgi:RNA polymerase sigma-70 factor (ECF subfamily)